MASAPTDDFDPDAYLANASGATAAVLDDFDPDAYLANHAKPAAARKSDKPFSMMDADIPVPLGGGIVTINPRRTLQTAKNLGLEGGLATAGQAIGAPFEAVGGMHIGGALGGGIGNALAQATTPGKKFSGGEVLAAMASGAIPGASLAKAGAAEVAKQGAKYAASNLAGVALQTGVDEGRLPTAGEAVMATAGGAAGAPISKFLDRGIRAEVASLAKSGDSFHRESIRLGREVGYVYPPSAVAPTVLNDSLHSLGGKAAVAQAAIHINQAKTNRAVAEQIGLPPGAPISPVSINTMRVEPNLVYDKVAKAVPESAQLLAEYKQANADANKLFTAYRSSLIKDPATLDQAKFAQLKAEQLETKLRSVVGNPLADELKNARLKLAEIGLAERAFSGGDFSAQVLGEALESGQKITGNMYKIARFENKLGRYVRDAANTPPSGVDHLKFLVKAGVAGAGAFYVNPVAAVAAPLAMMGAERGARRLVLSSPYQRLLANPFYGASLEDVPAAVGRLGAASVSRDLNLDEPLSEEEYRRYEELKAKLRGATE